MSINKRYLKIGVIVAAVLVAGYFILFGIPAYSIDTYIDIHTGDSKEVRRVYLIKVREEIKETEFSKLVRKITDVQKEPEWKYCFGKSWSPLGGRCISDSMKAGSILSYSRLFSSVDSSDITESELRDLVQGYLSDMEKLDSKGFYDRLDAYCKSHKEK